MGLLMGSSAAILLRRRLAISMAAAVSWASLGLSICSGGTTTDGPSERSSNVALTDESRRTPRRFSGGDSMVAFWPSRPVFEVSKSAEVMVSSISNVKRAGLQKADVKSWGLRG